MISFAMKLKVECIFPDHMTGIEFCLHSTFRGERWNASQNLIAKWNQINLKLEMGAALHKFAFYSENKWSTTCDTKWKTNWNTRGNTLALIMASTSACIPHYSVLVHLQNEVVLFAAHLSSQTIHNMWQWHELVTILSSLPHMCMPMEVNVQLLPRHL